jgi:hypothetical protein
MKTIIAALAVAAAIASPAFAQRLDRPWVDSRGIEISGARAKALRECSILETRIPEHSNEVNDLLIYRACMNDHGEVE